MRNTLSVLVIASVAALVSACGSSTRGAAPSAVPAPAPAVLPAPAPAPSPAPAPATATITIASGGMSPLDVTVAAGGTVMFVNNDTLPHDVQGGPDPEHPDCREIDAVGFLTPGQRRATNPLTTVRTCDYHDHSFHAPGFNGHIFVQ